MAIATALRAVILTSLSIALVLFLLRLVRRRRGQNGGAVDFGTAFSAFVAGWMATELLEIVAPAEWAEPNAILHFLVLALFAAWMNLRWRWSLQRAQEVS